MEEQYYIKPIPWGKRSWDITAHNENLFRNAQAGDQDLLDYFLVEHQCKVYTQEEIDLLNLLTLGGSRKLKDINLKESNLLKGKKKVFINLPDTRGDFYSAELCSLFELEEKYYLSYCLPLEEKWKEGWILRLDSREGFKPLFKTIGW
jgi:hypothetical protein